MIKTIGDLIKELEKYPQDALVFDTFMQRFKEVIYMEEIFCGDSANSNCEIVEGFILQ